MILYRLYGIVKLQSAIFSSSMQWMEKNISKTSSAVSAAARSKISSLPCSLSTNTHTTQQATHMMLQSREFHSSAVCCKYLDMKKRRVKFAKKMNMLQARLDRLDKEDRPTGCILCPMRGDIEIDHKNVRLLSQFISPHTGRIYGRALTGLCDKKQKEITKAIKRSRALGFMPVTMKYFEFHNDPRIF